MARITTVVATDTTPGGAFLPPPTDDRARRIVMPSPDLLYATCSLSLGHSPAHITFDGHYDRYWSIALYAANSDNFFVIGDRQTGHGPVDLWVTHSNLKSSVDTARNALTVESPSERVFLLMRLLVNESPEALADAERARRSLRCSH